MFIHYIQILFIYLLKIFNLNYQRKINKVKKNNKKLLFNFNCNYLWGFFFFFTNNIFYSFILFLINFIPFLISVAFIVHLERKVIGLTQYRDGPILTGVFGILQSIADGIKLILKETIIATKTNQFIFLLSPLWVFSFSFSFTNFLVYNLDFILINNHISLFYLFVFNTLTMFGLFLSGWSSNSKYAFLSTLRIIAQLISYELLFSFFLLFFIFWSNSLNLLDLIKMQSETFLYNNNNILFKYHFLPFCLIFFIIILAETNRTPFDLAESESELVSGYNTEYSAFPFALFFLSEYFNILYMSFLFNLFFFPNFTFFFLIVVKSLIILIFIILVRALLPRFRYDQLMILCWKHFIPILFSLFFLNLGIYKYFFFKQNFFQNIISYAIFL